MDSVKEKFAMQHFLETIVCFESQQFDLLVWWAVSYPWAESLCNSNHIHVILLNTHVSVLMSCNVTNLQRPISVANENSDYESNESAAINLFKVHISSDTIVKCNVHTVSRILW